MCSLKSPEPPSLTWRIPIPQEIRNIHNEELMGIRREEEMEMSDDDMEDAPESKDSDDSGTLNAPSVSRQVSAVEISCMPQLCSLHCFHCLQLEALPH